MSQLPQGWEIKKFTDVFDINGGTQPPKSEFISEPKEGYIRLLQIRDFGAKPVPTYIPDNGKRRTCTEDDILIGRYGASVGRICTGMSGAYNVALAKVAKPDYIDTGYLKYFLKSDVFQRPLSMLSRSAQNGFNKKDLSTFDFYQPPLEDQKRIADKLDSVLAKVEAAQARLDKIPTILKRFRQSVLAAATSGELTKDWREKNGVQFDFKEYGFDEILTELRNGLSAKPNEDRKGTPILRISSVRAMEIDQQDIRYLELSDKELEKYMLREGDLLFTRYNGSLEFVGVCGLLRKLEHENLVYPDKLIRARLNEKALPQFIEILFSSPHMREQVTGCVKTTSGQKGISGKNLKEQLVNLPDISEQKEIVRQVSGLLAKAESVEHRYLNSKVRLDSLTQSILSKAFSGRL